MRDVASLEYRAALQELFERRRFGIEPGLEAIEAILGELGSPQRKYPAVHITGSKGKGSTAAMVAAILSGHGRRVGLYTSPHLVSYRERIRVDGQMISREDVAAGLARVSNASRHLAERGALLREATFFECTTALAFDHFARSAVDAAVVEVGIGGRWDATNVLDSRAGVLTTIELEHTEILGSTVGAIAREKAGILHRGMAAYVGAVPEEALREIEAAADRVGAPLFHLGRELRVDERRLSAGGQQFSVRIPSATIERVAIPLFGEHMCWNAALAIGAASRFLAADDRVLEPAVTRRALTTLSWRGRLELLPGRPRVFLDVAHTPQSARALARSLAEIAPFEDPAESAIVFGCLRGKDADGILSALAPLARTVILVPIRSERALRPRELRTRAVAHFATVVLAPSSLDGLHLARAATGTDGFVLATGSDYLIGEILRALEGGAEEEPELSDPGRWVAPSSHARSPAP